MKKDERGTEMKLSELIKELLFLREIYGDINVLAEMGDYFKVHGVYLYQENRDNHPLKGMHAVVQLGASALNDLEGGLRR
jgi:hypothetical protein